MNRSIALFSCVVACLMSQSCRRTALPPYNDYQVRHGSMNYTIMDTGVGTAVGALASATGVGAVAGGVIGVSRQHRRDSVSGLERQLRKHDIEIIDDHDSLTLIVPTDKYYLLHKPKLNELQFEGLNLIAALLRARGVQGDIYIAGFTDNIGSKAHKRQRSRNLAQAMAAFLFAKGFPAKHLHPAGHSGRYAIASNRLIHGSAMNRRIEIQWRAAPIHKPL